MAGEPILYGSPFLHIIEQERREPLGVGRGEKLPYIYYYWSMPLSLFETMGLFQTKKKKDVYVTLPQTIFVK